jgi:predicted N-acetyltransferase YhbS
MSVKVRNYSGSKDFQAISDFLIANYQPDNADGNWLEPRWEYMHFRSDIIAKIDTGKIGIWEDNSKIVGVAHPEEFAGELFLQIHPEYGFLKTEMLDYAEHTLFGVDNQGKKFIMVFVYDTDTELVDIVKKRGYRSKDPAPDDYLSQYSIPEVFPKIQVQEGFKLISVQEKNEPDKIQRLVWRGFAHPGEPPAEQTSVWETIQTAPNYRRYIHIIVEAPNGDYAAYCGMWYVPENRYGYVEPVATDPNYRRLRLGRTAVLEGIRRCGLLGAKTAYVTTGNLFYANVGFKRIRSNHRWRKEI